MIYRVQHDKGNPYFLLNRAALDDERLSYKAIGIIAYLLSKPDSWTVQEADLINRHTDGATAVRTGLAELKKYGYFLKVPTRDDATGRITGWETHVFETPQDAKTHNVENPHSGKTRIWKTDPLVINDVLVSNDLLVNNEKISSFVRSDLDIAPPAPNETGTAGEAPGTNERTNDSISLLTDESILMGRNATIAKLAATYPFEDIRAFCCKFIDEGKTPGKDAGIIAYWLEASETIPPTTHGDFYQRHRTPAEIAADAVREAEAIEENRRWEERRAQRIPPPVAPPPPAAVAVLEPAPTARPSRIAPAQIWAAVLVDLALSTPAPTFEEWLRDTDVLGYVDGEFVIGVPHAYARDWLTSRLRPQIRRILSRITQRSTDVSFAVRPRESQEATDVRENR